MNNKKKLFAFLKLHFYYLLLFKFSSVFKLPPIRKLRFDYWENPNAELLEFLKHSSPTSTKLVSFGWNQSNYFKLIDYYVEGLEVAFKGATMEIAMHGWAQSKESFQRLVKAGAGVKKFIFRAFKSRLDSDLDFTGPEYKIQVGYNILLKRDS